MICISIYRQCLTILVGIETKTRVMSTEVAVEITHDCEAFPFVDVRMRRHMVRPCPPRRNSTAKERPRTKRGHAAQRANPHPRLVGAGL